MTAWTTETLESCLEALLDYRGKSPTKSESGIPVLSAKVVKTAGLLRPIEQTIAPDYYPKWMTRGLPMPGDVVMTTEAPLGEVIQLDEETASFALGQRLVCLRGKAGKLDNTFLRYLLTSPGQQEVLANRATGTTVLGISQKTLRSMPIAFPGFTEQKRIGDLLATLDDKIELNRRMNETLEAMARALFRDWFVDFGPTRAKMAGTAPYLSPDLWSLFPDRLDDAGMPEGWEIVPARTLIDFNPTERLSKGHEAAYLDMAAIPTSGPITNPPRLRPFTSGSKFRRGDALLARITPCLENGKTALVHDLGDDAVGWGSTEFVVMRATEPMPEAYAYILARDENFREKAVQSMTGTSGRQRAQVDTISGIPLARPTNQIALAFGRIVEAMFCKIFANAEESRTVAQTRDLLLPRLMSGELRVADLDSAKKETTA